MDELFLNYERYGADGVLIDLLFVLDPAERALSISKALTSNGGLRSAAQSVACCLLLEY